MAVSRIEKLFPGVPDNPYVQQLARGFGRLQFMPELERQYLDFIGLAAVRQRRIAVVLALLVWHLFVALDAQRIGPLENFQQYPQDLQRLLGLRWGVAGLLYLGGLLVLFRRMQSFILGVTPWLIMACGVATGVINMLYTRAGFSASYDGVILLTIAVFFPLGMTVYSSLWAGLGIVFGSLLIGNWLLHGEALGQFNLSMFYCFLAVIVSASGAYLREYSQREQFLTRHLLHWMAERDGLTGLYNRRSFDQRLPQLLSQARRARAAVALLLVDVDHFKPFNDHYGHQAGDQALQQVARLLQGFARRPLDMAVRLGGEEFALVLYGESAEGPQQVAEQVRQAIEQLAIAHAASPSGRVLTASLGLALSGPAESLDHLYHQADQALYRAKHAGRNRVEHG